MQGERKLRRLRWFLSPLARGVSLEKSSASQAVIIPYSARSITLLRKKRKNKQKQAKFKENNTENKKIEIPA